MENEIQFMEVGKVHLTPKAKYWKAKAIALKKLLAGVSIAMYIMGALTGSFIATFF